MDEQVIRERQTEKEREREKMTGSTMREENPHSEEEVKLVLDQQWEGTSEVAGNWLELDPSVHLSTP